MIMQLSCLKLFFLLYFLFACKVICIPVPHSPKFHTPNDFDSNGATCSSSYPNLVKKCPIFGVISKGKTNAEIEAQCQYFGFVCPEPDMHLFIDGSCRNCPENMVFVEDETDVYCQDENNPENVLFKSLINPFDCSSSDSLDIKREQTGLYRPCSNEDHTTEVEIQNYSYGLDLSDVLTLTTCAKNLHHPTTPSYVSLENGFESLPFSTIGSLKDVEYAPSGYLQCSRLTPPPRDMLSALWIFIYSFYSIGLLYILGFYIFKIIKEKININEKLYTMKSVDNNSLTIESESEFTNEINFIKQNNITQTGCYKSIFGKIGFAFFAALSIGLVVFLILIIMDIFGLHYSTFCKHYPEVQEACKISLSNGTDPNWRLGYTCSAGCLFSFSPSNGIDPDWPYYNNPGGGQMIEIYFIVVWHVSIIWFLYIKLFSKQIQFFFYIKTTLKNATYILVSKPIEDEIILQSASEDIIRKISAYATSLLNKLRGQPCHYEFCKIKKEKNIYSFDFQCLRYCWNESSLQFEVSQFPITGTHEEISKNYVDGLTDIMSKSRLCILGSNAIEIEIPPLYMSILTEFFDALYLYQFSTLLVWIYTYYWTVSLVTIIIILVSATLKIVTKRKSQWKVKQMAHRSLDVYVYRNNEWKLISSKFLVPGDLIKITQTCTIPCDCVLLDGRCVLDESTLTGEPTPVPKISISPTSKFEYDQSQSNMKYTLFAGSYLQSFSHGRTNSTLAVVVATGATTSKGKLMKDLLYPPPFSFTFEQHLNAVYIVLLMWCAVVMCLTIYFLGAVLQSWFLSIFIAAQIFTPLIPAVYVAALSQGAIHLSKKNVFCVNFHRMAVAGKIHVFCFDKTGTLTKPGLEFRGIQYVSETSKKFSFYSTEQIYPRNVSMFCGSCHELDFIPKNDDLTDFEIVGNEVDTALFSSSRFSVELKDSTNIMRNENTAIKILRRFEFDRATMTMSVIVENELGEKYVFTKGSYEVIARLVTPASLPSNYFKKADSLAKEGIYMLGMGYKLYDGPSNIFEISRENLETNLICLGLIMFENPLKDQTTAVIQELKDGNISPRILTGDNSLTATCIARKCRVSEARRIVMGDLQKNNTNTIFWKDFDTDEAIDDIQSLLPDLRARHIDLAITGRAFLALLDIRKENKEDEFLKTFMPYIRIFSRLTPDQKVTVIGEQMQLGLTGMCGDGANDLGALRLAHCGIAISASSSEAGLVSHFSSPGESLVSVVDVLKEGRSTLSKALSSFKALIVFGQTKALIGLMQYYFFVVAPEMYWITWDGIVYLGTAWCLLQSTAAKRLHDTRPTSKMFGFETIFSVCSIVFINWSFMIGALIYLFSYEWFSCKQFNPDNIDPLKWWLKGDNYESSVISIIATFQFMSAGLAFNFGYRYRTFWFRNYWLIGFAILTLIFYSFVFLSGPNFLSCLFRTQCGDKSLIEHWINIGKLDKSSAPSTAPVGCDCTDQLALGQNLCEEEYINCNNDVYNSRFHHNILDSNSLKTFYFIGLSNFILDILWEFIVVLGPIRTLVKKYFKKNVLKPHLL